MSSTRWAGWVKKALIQPAEPGMIAIPEVRAPSGAFSVDATGWPWPSGHKGREESGPIGIAVAFKTKTCALDGILQALAKTWKSLVPLIGGDPAGSRVSSTRQSARSLRDRPPGPAAAK